MWLPEDLSQATAEGWRSFWLVPGGLATLAVVLVLMLLPRHGPGPAPAPSGGGTAAAA
jgi:hypothetical protein